MTMYVIEEEASMTDKAKLYAVKNDEGEWMSLDGTQTGIWYSNNPTLFKDKSYAEAQSMGRRAHVVELVEAPEKVVVNEKEASLLEKMADGTNFNGERGFEPGLVITNFVLNNPVHGESHFETEDRLMRAYVNGWTVKKPKRYVLPMAGTNDGKYKLYAHKSYDRSWNATFINDSTPITNVRYTVTDADLEDAPEWIKAIGKVEVHDD